MDIKDLLKEIITDHTPSGREPEAAFKVKELFGKFFDEVKVDKLGNIIGKKTGKDSKFKVMIAAHMDEIGMMVTKIEEKGFIRFTFVGGIDQRILLGQEVLIHGKEIVPGIIGSKPPHLQEPDEKSKALKKEDLFIDTGLSYEKIKDIVSVGDFITFKRRPVELLNNHFASNALDDKAGIAAILCCIEELKKLIFSADVYGVATVQEEVGLRGAITSTYGIYPDIGIAVDVGHGNIPDLPEEETFKLGKGPVIALGPNIHPKIYERLKNLADEYKIPYQIDPNPSYTGTDAWSIQITRAGVPTGLISIPLRYMHTTVETLNTEDIKLIGRLLALFIASVDTEFVEGLKCY
ncbi:M42 family metallopeptidase [Thermovenabulum sp.]|uniref:M42 family metallopeptidase n=1 Tax=Thermovenabulum sp. TaxID=3100335 RepID=UPI003C7A17A7